MGNQTENREVAIQLSGVKKMYKLGQIGGGTLQGDLQSWWARVRGKEDPNTKIGTDQRLVGQTFMALNGIDLTVYKGEALGIIGGNGAGKSTMLKLLSRVTAPTEGEIDIYGRIASMLEVGTGFNGEMTGRENIYMNGAILGMTKAEIDAKMEDIIEFSEVREFIDTPVKRYSSGMYVKLAFSVAAHLDSEIMIMDEVLAVGDMAFQKKCLDKMRDAAKKEGRTVLYVSHNNISECIRQHPEKFFSHVYGSMRKHNVEAFRNNGLPGMYFTHMGVPFCKSSMQRTWNKYKEECIQTCSYKIRDIHQITHQIYSIEDILSGNFVPEKNDWGTIILIENMGALRWAYESRANKMICLADRDNVTPEEVESINRSLTELFEQIFPKISVFEKSGGSVSK